MNRYSAAFIIISATLLVFGACSPAGGPAPGAPALTAVPATKAATGSQGWDELVAAAKKEGAMTSYANLGPTVRDALTNAFRAKYGINIEWLAGRPAELIAKIKAERSHGLYLPDIAFNGGTTFMNDLKPMGVSLPLEPMLVLPEVKEAKNWRGGALPFLDKEKMAFTIVLFANSFFQRNIDLVKEGEVNATLDLLHPKWKEKIVISDPSISGAANAWFTWTLVGVLGREKGAQFMKDLVAQKPTVTRDERQLTEWLAKGKFHLAVGPSMSVPAEFIQMGAPIAFVEVKEPRSLSAGFGIISVFKDAPHPNAAKLFLNWILTREGSSIFAPAIQYASLRVDVPPQGILPIMVPRSNDVYPEVTYDNYSLTQGEMRQVASEIFAPLLK